MNITSETITRLFDPRPAMHEPMVLGAVAAVVAAMAVTPLVARFLPEATRRDVLLRWRGWLLLTPLILVPIVLGAAWTMAAILLLALLCHRELARATGLFRERAVSAAVTGAILVTYFAAADHYYFLFVALWPLSVGLIALAGLVRDRPRGYLQRIALGVLSYMLLGAGLAHLAFIANDAHYRTILIWLIVSVELNDIFAYCCGKLLGPLTGNKRLAPRTSPNKTLAGSLGAVVLTTLLVVALGRIAFRGEVIAQGHHLFTLGLMIAVLGQCGDLLLSSVKRDLGVKDLGAIFPGHGGLLDRFDSMLLAAPAVFHYVRYVRGIGLDQAERIVTAGWF